MEQRCAGASFSKAAFPEPARAAPGTHRGELAPAGHRDSGQCPPHLGRKSRIWGRNLGFGEQQAVCPLPDLGPKSRIWGTASSACPPGFGAENLGFEAEKLGFGGQQAVRALRIWDRKTRIWGRKTRIWGTAGNACPPGFGAEISDLGQKTRIWGRNLGSGAGLAAVMGRGVALGDRRGRRGRTGKREAAEQGSAAAPLVPAPLREEGQEMQFGWSSGHTVPVTSREGHGDTALPPPAAARSCCPWVCRHLPALLWMVWMKFCTGSSCCSCIPGPSQPPRMLQATTGTAPLSPLQCPHAWGHCPWGQRHLQ